MPQTESSPNVFSAFPDLQVRANAADKRANNREKFTASQKASYDHYKTYLKAEIAKAEEESKHAARILKANVDAALGAWLPEGRSLNQKATVEVKAELVALARAYANE